MNSTASWLGAWVIVIVALLALSQTKVGSTLLYYILWLAVVLLLVTHSQELTNILTQGGIIPSGNTSGS